MSYVRFGTMIATSTVVMFVLMYLNTYAIDHIEYSQTRTWMALVMGAAMSVIMLSFMLSMYTNRLANAAIFIASVLVFSGALWLVRSQQTVDDVAYMKAMIPHHSIAVMTSERAQIRDPRRPQARGHHHRVTGERDRRDATADRRPRKRADPGGCSQAAAFRRGTGPVIGAPDLRTSTCM